MPLSMTGFGRAREHGSEMQVSMQIKSLNSRYFDLTIKGPTVLAALESDWRRLIRQEISRGKIELRVDFFSENCDQLMMKTDLARAQVYARAYRELAHSLGETCPPLTSLLGRQADILSVEDELGDETSIRVLCQSCLNQCLSSFHRMRAEEGQQLARDMQRRLTTMQTWRQDLAQKAPLVPQHYRERLLARVQELLQDQVEEYYDGHRVAAEVAIFADKADITEELVRLNSHFHQFSQILDEPGPVGKKLDFLIQEMNRETNTIASKSQDLEMTQMAVHMKNAIEQIREQVQNLE